MDGREGWAVGLYSKYLASLKVGGSQAGVPLSEKICQWRHSLVVTPRDVLLTSSG